MLSTLAVFSRTPVYLIIFSKETTYVSCKGESFYNLGLLPPVKVRSEKSEDSILHVNDFDFPSKQVT